MVANCWDKGIPPVAGGFGDQPNWAMEAIAIVNNWKQEYLSRKSRTQWLKQETSPP